MKNSILKYLTFLALIFLMSCSENEPENIDDTNQNPPDEEELFVCVGNQSSDYWPLELDNHWIYASGDLVLTITEKVEIDGKDYFKVDPTGPLSWNPIYLRVDSNGDIYQSSSPSSTETVEKLYLPNNPTLNQEWDSFGTCIIGPCTFYKKVESIDYTLETNECIYEDCLAIRSYTVLNDGTISEGGLDIFKRGIGLIASPGLFGYRITDLSLE
jgi:hypothetical protein